jgi:hypothetical protein
MARPRTIQLEQGIVSLQDFPKEVADALSEHIKNFGKSVPTLEQVVEAPVVVSSEEMPDVALSVRVEPGTQKAQLVTVKYNADTRQATVTNIEYADGKQDAINKFKYTCVKLNFV